MDPGINNLIYEGDCFGQVYLENGRFCRICGVKEICKERTEERAKSLIEERLKKRGGNDVT